jgi:hypothetical protein
MSNKIPRNFNCITGKMLIETNMNIINDVVKIYKDEYNRYLSLNVRTNKYASPFISMLRNSELFEIIKII